MKTMNPFEDYVWVFVGCGGTFYAASPYLAVLCERYGCKMPVLIDPDHVTIDNHDRQWPAWSSLNDKVGVAGVALGRESVGIVGKFNTDDRMLCNLTNGKPVIAIVNVDNNAARLEVAQWLSERHSDGIMIVSGCERTFGQCYPGIWKDGEPVYDWREGHRDVVLDSSSTPSNPCNAQDVRANALTGVLVGMCIESVATQVEHHSWISVQEFYWSVAPVRMWVTVASCKERMDIPCQ